jgi:hypothetical protein
MAEPALCSLAAPLTAGVNTIRVRHPLAVGAEHR